MNTVYANILREVKLFVHTPLVVHLCIIQLLVSLFLKKSRPPLSLKRRIKTDQYANT